MPNAEGRIRSVRNPHSVSKRSALVFTISLYPITTVFLSHSDPQVLTSDLVDLLFRAADLAINITRVVTDDPQIDNILYLVENILSFPEIQSNITCIFEEIFNDSSVQELLGNLAVFQNFVS